MEPEKSYSRNGLNIYNRPMDGMSHDVCVTFVPNQIQDRPALRGRGMDRGRGRGAPAHGPIGRGHVTLTSAPNRRRSRSVREPQGCHWLENGLKVGNWYTHGNGIFTYMDG